MKILSALILLCMMISAAAHAQTPDQLWQQGNSAFQQGKYADAITAYEGVLKSGYVSGELHYNLGNAYYKAGNVPGAILHYERAQRFLPTDEDLHHNLQLANLLITDKIEIAPRLFLWNVWDDLKGAFSHGGITWLTYGFYLMIAAGIVVVLLARSYRGRKIGLAVALVGLLLFVFSLTILLAKYGDANRTDDAIVMAAIVTVKNSPDSKSSDAFVLHAGVKVRMTDAVSGWIKIRLADGKVGWVERSTVEVI